MEKTIHSEVYSDDIFYNHITKEDNKSSDYRFHFHDVTEIIFFKSGNISYVAGGKKYKLKENTLVFSRPTDWHCISIDGPEKYDRYNILYDEKKLPFNIYKKIPSDINIIDFGENRNVIEVFNKMDFYSKKLSGESLDKIMKNLIEEIFFNIVIEVDTERQNAYEQTNPIVSRAISYIDKNVLTISGIEDICSQLFITKSHLHHLFAKHLKISPKKYITVKRLAIAQREIYAGKKAIDVCQKCGFSDYSAFFRAYKNHFGRCPSDVALAHPMTDLRGDISRKYE